MAMAPVVYVLWQEFLRTRANKLAQLPPTCCFYGTIVLSGTLVTYSGQASTRLGTRDQKVSVQKLRSPDVMRDLCLDRGLLLAALRNCVNETGMEHFQLARKLGVDSWTVLEWIKGTIRPKSASLLAIRHFLEEYGPKYLAVRQRDDQTHPQGERCNFGGLA